MRIVNTNTLVINKSVLGQVIPSFGMTLEEYAVSRGRTIMPQGELIMYNDRMPDIDNVIRDLKVDLVGLGYVLGGKDFANTDVLAFWVLDYEDMISFKEVNSNFQQVDVAV